MNKTYIALECKMDRKLVKFKYYSYNYIMYIHNHRDTYETSVCPQHVITYV